MKHHPPQRLPRGRPRGFDADVVIQRAMDVFWSKGYNATALPDLLDATQLSRGSLYAAFGDKHGLFLQALDRYIADAMARARVELGTRDDPIAALRGFLAGYVSRTCGAGGRRGCLLVATAMELAGRDPEVDRRVRHFLESTQSSIEATLLRAQATGQLADGCDPANVARLIICVVEGMRVVGKTAPKRETMQTTVDTLIDRLIR